MPVSSEGALVGNNRQRSTSSSPLSSTETDSNLHLSNCGSGSRGCSNCMAGNAEINLTWSPPGNQPRLGSSIGHLQSQRLSITPEMSPERHRSMRTSGYGSGRKSHEEWSSSSGSQEDLVSSSSIGSSPRKGSLSSPQSARVAKRLQRSSQSSPGYQKPHTSAPGSPTDDNRGFANVVPFPCPPKRNVFIEPGSGMRDVPMWLKSLRLHKYTSLFQQMSYEEMLNLTEEQLEKENVTKGARHKIVVCVQKLVDRVEHLKQLEKDLIEPGSHRTTLGELKQMIMTPIRPYPPPGRPEPDQARIDGTDDTIELDEENLPAYFTRVLAKLCVQMLGVQTNGEQEDENFATLLHILDRCINHEAFTQAQKRRVINFKQVVKRVWNPPTMPGMNRRTPGGFQGRMEMGSPGGRLGSWKGDVRRKGNGKWHLGSPPPTRKWPDAPCPPGACNGLHHVSNNCSFSGFMGNFSCPSQMMQNVQMHAAMIGMGMLAAQANQQQINNGFPYPQENNIVPPSMQRTASGPPMTSMQQMAAALAALGCSGQGSFPSGPSAFTNPQQPFLHPQSVANGNTAIPSEGTERGSTYGVSSRMSPPLSSGNGWAKEAEKGVGFPTESHSSEESGGNPSPPSTLNNRHHSAYQHNFPPPNTNNLSPGLSSPSEISSWAGAGDLLNAVQWATQGYGNDSSLPRRPVQGSTTYPNTNPNPNANSINTSQPSDIRNNFPSLTTQLSAPAALSFSSVGGNGPPHNTDSPIIDLWKDPALEGTRKPHQEHNGSTGVHSGAGGPLDLNSHSLFGYGGGHSQFGVGSNGGFNPIGGPIGIPSSSMSSRGRNQPSPSPLSAYNFGTSGSFSDINSRMETLCRSVAEVAMGGLECGGSGGAGNSFAAGDF